MLIRGNLVAHYKTPQRPSGVVFPHIRRGCRRLVAAAASTNCGRPVLVTGFDMAECWGGYATVRACHRIDRSLLKD